MLTTVFSKQYLKKYFSTIHHVKPGDGRPKYADIVAVNEIRPSKTADMKQLTSEPLQHTSEP